MQIKQFVPKPIRRFLSPNYQSFRKRRNAYLGPFVQWNAIRRGYRYEIENEAIRPVSPPKDAQDNPLRTFFNNRTEGPGIWKWDHYFDIYDRHFNKFRDTEVHILEIGIFSGGSLDMWRDYFGPRAYIYGVDIEEACRAYERDRTKILIGDQGDRQFWRTFREQVPLLDIVVDDGSHQTEDQIVTFEQLLPHLRPGVYTYARTCTASTVLHPTPMALATSSMTSASFVRHSNRKFGQFTFTRLLPSSRRMMRLCNASLHLSTAPSGNPLTQGQSRTSGEPWASNIKTLLASDPLQ
jgi:hypothetical protein